MTFISYAQNFEDVLLWRALGHIKNGFYIDVGANDPVEHSVTKAFYDAGWHGINIEPLPAFHQAFLEQRPRDINLAIAAGASEGSLTLFDVPAVNGWASPDRTVADAHRADGFEVTELTVPVRTLASVCEEHARGAIHYLKVDVEGFEGEVLRGMDFVKWRPWLLVIEATLPNSRVTNHESWEALVTGQRYTYAYFDGLNRYYVADEHSELLDVLSIPPNVFDDFITHHLDSAWRAAQAAEAAGAEAHQRLAKAAELQWQAEKRADTAAALAHDAIAHSADLLAKYNDATLRAENALEETRTLRSLADGLHARLDQLGAEAHKAEVWGREMQLRLLATMDSTSWRVTAPLRAAGSLLRHIRAGSAQAAARRQLRRVVLRVTANERMRRLLIPVLLRFPGSAAKVSQMLNAIKQAAPDGAQASSAALQVPDELRALPVSARKVLADLQRARRNHSGT